MSSSHSSKTQLLLLHSMDPWRRQDVAADRLNRCHFGGISPFFRVMIRFLILVKGDETDHTDFCKCNPQDGCKAALAATMTIVLFHGRTSIQYLQETNFLATIAFGDLSGSTVVEWCLGVGLSSVASCWFYMFYLLVAKQRQTYNPPHNLPLAQHQQQLAKNKATSTFQRQFITNP